MKTFNCHGKGVLEIKCPYRYKDSLNGWEKDKDFPHDVYKSIKISPMMHTNL